MQQLSQILNLKGQAELFEEQSFFAMSSAPVSHPFRIRYLGMLGLILGGGFRIKRFPLDHDGG